MLLPPILTFCVTFALFFPVSYLYFSENCYFARQCVTNGRSLLFNCKNHIVELLKFTEEKETERNTRMKR